MDPQACLSLILASDTPWDADTREHIDNLMSWLNRGGFKPEVSPEQTAQLAGMQRQCVLTGHPGTVLAIKDLRKKLGCYIPAL
jgi:hypothetical protein